MKSNSNLIFSLTKESFIIIVGIFVAAFGLKSFLVPNGVIDGGITGISLLLSFVTTISLSLLILVINLPFVFLAKRELGNIFAIKTFLAISGLAFVLLFIQFPTVTFDKLLATAFGGFLIGTGTGLAVRGGCVIDGTEVLAIYLSRRFGPSIGEIIFCINVVIFSIAAFILGVEAALYSILTYLVASKTIDFVVHGIEEYIGLTIISKKSHEIRHSLIKNLNKGVTVYKGKGGYDNESEMEVEILYTFITRLEVTKIKQNIISIDPKAVIIEQGIKDIHGGMIKRRSI